MLRNTVLALAAGGALMVAGLTGSTGSAQADTSVHIGIGVPGVHLTHSTQRRNCWLPERHLCGPAYGRPVYGGPVYGGPVYGGPVYGGPVYGGPVYGGPVYGPPIYGRPVYGWPVYRGGYRAPPYYYRSGRYRRW